MARRMAPVCAIFALLCLATPGVARSAGGGGESAAQRLIEAYTPRLMVRATDNICDIKGEQYEATTVDTVLGNPAVTLTEADSSGNETLVKRAPTAKDIAGLGEGFHLNLPGNPLGDTCVYARDFAQLKREGKAPPVTYAHIARQKGRAGLAVQYWFFWYFNEFNDLHEGDWEGMQVVFDSSDPAVALREGPSAIGLFQHGGGEKADWNDGKVEKEGTHPVVYPAAGSHATFYEPAVYIQNGRKGSGVGCDNTSDAQLRVNPRPVRVPTHPGPGRPVRLAHLRGPLGPVGEELQQRPDRAADEDALAGADDLDGRNPLDQPAPAGRIGAGADRDQVLLRRRRRRHLVPQPHPGRALGADRGAGRPPAAARLDRLAHPLAAARPRRPAPRAGLRPAAARLGRPLLAPLARLRPDRPQRDPDRRRLQRAELAALRRSPGAGSTTRPGSPACTAPWGTPQRHRRPDRLGDHRRGRDRRRAPDQRARRGGLRRVLSRHVAALPPRRRRPAAGDRWG